ncbi:hypothetical protein EC973_000637 [Apophysomyces ossiformis]|uniref:RRM domain-containing protein n=1 Tax=Apophysomyces ossiformis TaxID=679940 RepID=A0A8H7BYR7_9FUNG|nr:hypothetical protein EC973_000637 [Apophysomyces ossiformis]
MQDMREPFMGTLSYINLLTPCYLGTQANNTEHEKSDYGYVDYMNLYIKNLDPTITNAHLSTLFRKFGRIVSARVMHNPATGQSKGYGFVSFAKPEEAAAALHGMCGQIIAGKPLIVAYHEPKKGRQERADRRLIKEGDGVHEHTLEYNYPPPRYPRASPEPPGNTMSTNVEIKRAEQSYIGRRLSSSNHFPQRQHLVAESHTRISPQIPFSSNAGTNAGLSLASLASGIAVQPSPHYISRVERPTCRRRESVESMTSVMTESSADLQRQKLSEAVLRCGDYGNQVMDIVDLLLTLKRKERSLCLFNQDFLRQKIKLAMEALEAFNDEKENEDEKILQAANSHNHNITMPQQIRPQSLISPRCAPSILPAEKSESATLDKPWSDEEIKKLLDMMQDKPLPQQKHLLGNHLFPLVKVSRKYQYQSKV